MAELNFDLKHGLLTGKGTADETLHTTVRLRELTSKDIVDAQLASERVAFGANGKAVAYCSEVLYGLEMLRRQIAAVGTLPGPLSLELLYKLDPSDLKYLTEQAQALDDMLEDVSERGRDDAAGGGTE
ncbi:MAG: phage tail assembly protein [Citrobacter sp.]